MTLVREHGEEGLRARSRSGALPRLTVGELNLLPELLVAGAETYGFRGEVWTCARIAKLLEWVFGVVYHRAHVSRLLKQLGWTPQKPLERAAQRNEAQIMYWRTTVWEELKKRPGVSGAPWFLWMKAAFIYCPPWSGPMPRVESPLCCAQS